jgi:hypothetical protein
MFPCHPHISGYRISDQLSNCLSKLTFRFCKSCLVPRGRSCCDISIIVLKVRQKVVGSVLSMNLLQFCARFEVLTVAVMKTAVFWMLSRVALVTTDVSEERSASIIKGTRID